MSRCAVVVACLLAIATACTKDASGVSGYDLHEFAIEGPTSLAAGVRSLEVANSGEFPHTLVVARADGTVVAATNLIQPGESALLELDLEAGVYQFTCRIVSQRPDGQIVDHFEEGMSRTVSVGT